MTHSAHLVSSSMVERVSPRRAPEEHFLASFTRLLNTHRVDFLVVGQQAAAFHECPTFEHYADLIVLPTADNIRRLTLCLIDFGFGHLGISARDFTGRAALTLGRAPHQIDIMTYVPGVEIEAAWSRRVMGTFGTVPVPFLSRLTRPRSANPGAGPRAAGADLD
jgi:hypothetical protein